MATQTDASAVTGMAVDRVGNVFYSDSDGNRVRRIDARTGVVSTIAGNGIAGCSGDGELGLLGQLYLPQGVAVDGIGNVYVAATGNSQVRRIDAETGVMTTVLGDGTLDLDLRDLPINQERVAVNSPCPDPKYLALDGNQYLMVFDGENDNLLKLDLYTGKVVRWAGLKSSSNDNIGIPAENADLGGLVNFTVGQITRSISRIAPTIPFAAFQQASALAGPYNKLHVTIPNRISSVTTEKVQQLPNVAK